MADRNTRKLTLSLLQDDLAAYAALKAIGDFTPSNPTYSLTNGTAAKDAMETAQTKAVQDEATAKASRDSAVIKEWEFHDFIRNARIQVKAQFGENSDQVQAMGLKKKSEYKSPTKSKTTPTP